MEKRKLLITAGVGWLFDAMDVGIVSFIVAALEKSWHLTTQQVGLVGSINSIGMAVGALVAGICADRWGRKPVLIASLLIFSIASGLSAFVTVFSLFLALRFLIGAGLGGELPVASTLVSESVPERERGRTVVLLESFWAFGWLLSAIIAYFVIPRYGWQAAVLIGTIPAFYAVYLRFSLPESRKKSTMKQSFFKPVALVWSKPYFQTTTMLWILWFSVTFSYYGMFMWLPTVMVLKGFTLIKSFQYVLIMTLAQLPGYYSAAWFIERVGRKFVLVLYLTGTAVSAFYFGTAGSLFGLMVSGILLSFFNLGAWGALYAYTPEQYPATIRSTGAGMAASFGRLGGIFGPLMVGYLVAAHVTFTTIFTIFCIITLLGVIAVLVLGKETKGLATFDTIRSH